MFRVQLSMDTTSPQMLFRALLRRPRLVDRCNGYLPEEKEDVRLRLL